MNQTVFKPGQIWPGTDLEPSLLEAQWNLELRHQSPDVDLSQLAFSESDWTDLEWNAREALHLNGKGTRYPNCLRILTVEQDSINIHLIRAFHNLLGAWQQWILLPYVRSINSIPASTECSFLLNQAWGRLERAREKYDSLISGKKFLHQFSLRQWRLMQHLGALLCDLDPLVRGRGEYLKRDPQNREDAGQIENDITWHSRELQGHLGQLAYRPGLLRRLRSPRLEINRMLALSCLFQSRFLKDFD